MSRFFFCLLCYLVLHNHHVSAQDSSVVKRIKNALETRNFDSLQNTISNTYAHWELLRDLTLSSKEGVLDFGYIIKDKDNPAMGTDYRFRVNIITFNSTIAFYEFGRLSYCSPGNWECFRPITKFKDKKAFSRLKSEFDSIFHSRLNENELFNTEFVYGQLCGFGASEPEGRVSVNHFVQKLEKESLLHWLKSANTEKQIYAVDGLFQLKQQGISLSQNELEMINFVLNKKGTMTVCAGCIFGTREISEVVKKQIQFLNFHFQKN